MADFNRLLIMPFHERWAAKERIRKGEPLFGGFSLTSASSDPGAWQAKPVTPPEDATAKAFKILGLTKGSASEGDVKRAYRQLALTHHPDRGGDVKKFHALSAAKDLCLKEIGAV